MRHPILDNKKQVVELRELKQPPIIPAETVIPPTEMVETERRLREIRNGSPARKRRFWQR